MIGYFNKSLSRCIVVFPESYYCNDGGANSHYPHADYGIQRQTVKIISTALNLHGFGPLHEESSRRLTHKLRRDVQFIHALDHTSFGPGKVAHEAGFEDLAICSSVSQTLAISLRIFL